MKIFLIKSISLVLSIIIYCSTFAQAVPKQIAIEASVKHYDKLYNTRPFVENVKTVSINDTVCYYLIGFRDSGWCVISADYAIEPVLAFGNSTLSDDDTVHAFMDLLHWYSDQIISDLRKENPRVENPRWSQLLSNSLSTRYIPFDYGLLDKTGRGNNMWGQYGNNNFLYGYGSDCSPTYNADCPSNNTCECGHKPVGCGAVAIGQLMWYWKWPKNTNWEIIPGELTSYTPSDKARALTQYLRDCGNDVNMHYMCAGSWTLMGNIFDALQNKGYMGIKQFDADDWAWGNSWEKLLMTEIDNKRPVIMYGESFTFVTGHYFVVDDYYVEGNETWFHVNWGHRNYANGYCKIDRLHEGDDYYNINNKAIVGISPTYNENIINSLPYSVIPDDESRIEYAYRDIYIPDEELTIESGGSFTAESGKEITLKPGFRAELGSSVNIRINETWQNQMAISIPLLINSFDPLCDSTYHLTVFNADSWEFTLCDLNYDRIYQDAGSVNDTIVHLWNGVIGLSYCPYGLYHCTIAFKNSFGRRIENTFDFVLQPHNYAVGNSADSLNLRGVQSQFDFTEKTESDNLTIYPNPTSGIVNFVALGDTISSIMIYDQMGICHYIDCNIGTSRYSVNLDKYPKTNYFAVIIGEKAIYRKKITLQ